MDITFCTFYFDIDRKNWDAFTVSNEMYMHWFDNLLSLDIKLYILTEKKFVDRILKTRLKIDPDFSKTIIKETTIDQLPSYKIFNDRLEKLMYSEEFQMTVHHKHVPEMTKPLYNVLMFNKVNYLQQVSDINPFNTEYFGWVDAGFIRGANEIENIKKWPDPSKLLLVENKIKFFCINDNIKNHTVDIKRHVMSQMRLLKGTIFFLHRNLISPLQVEFCRQVEYVLSQGYVGSDEKIFDLCCLNKPDWFDLYKCNWREELKLFSYEYNKTTGVGLKNTIKTEHTVEVEWTDYDIELCHDFKFLFFCIEDDKHESIYREDLQVDSLESYEKFKNYKKTYKIVSDRKPTNFVVWPVSKSKGFLKYVNKPVRLL